MKKSKWLLAALAIIMVLGVSIGSAMAYFTTFVTAKGGMPIKLGDSEFIEEPDISNHTKHIRVHNDGPDSCYVRAKAIVGSTFDGKWNYVDSTGLWVPGDDDYMYYTEVLPGGTAVKDEDYSSKEKADQAKDDNPSYTKELQVYLKDVFPPEGEAKEGDEMNVVVVYESLPVVYDKEGNPYPYNDEHIDWSQKVDVHEEIAPIVQEEGGNS